MALARSYRWLGSVALIGVVLLANAPLLDDFARLLGRSDPTTSTADTATHFLRMLNARDLYLPSGHRLGWDPYWYQGYVPFLLYPHLTYFVLALVSLALPVEPARVFNAYTVAIYFALPLLAGWLVSRSKGLAAAAVAAAWFAVLSTYGAGLRGVFRIGLLSQQAGVILFTALAYDLIVARRLDRAAIWLGLLPLVHVHASLIGAGVWLVAGILVLAERRGAEFRTWLSSSMVALFIASPTVLALAQGWKGTGRRASFGTLHDVTSQVLDGSLIAPLATLVAIAMCLIVGATKTIGIERRRFLAWGFVGMLLGLLASRKWSLGIPEIDGWFSSVLYLRTFPFAFVLLALLAIGPWPGLPRTARTVVALLTAFGIVQAWSMESKHAPHIGASVRAEVAGGQADYLSALDWIAGDVGRETATLAISVPRPIGPSLLAAVQRCRLPLLGGHGSELTSIINASYLQRVENVPCEQVERNLRDYAVGYIVGSSSSQRKHLEGCLETSARFEAGDWWVLATGHRWETTPGSKLGFTRNAAWTELEWKLRERRDAAKVRLPIANSAPWIAEAGGSVLPISSTSDHMMQVTVPAGATSLRLRYAGYAGEWVTVAVSVAAFGFAIARTRRRSGATS